MATFFTGDVGGIDLSAFDLAAITTGTPTTMSGTVYRLPNAEFQGGNFTYTGNSLTGGTITTIIVFSGGDEAYRITNLNLLVSAVDAFVATNDSQGFLGAVFSGKDVMDGSESADHLIGYADDDTLDGNGGNDTLDGGAGNDRLDGGAGNDTLIGNDGADTLDGTTGGDDSMDGGAGSDVYFVDSTKDVTKDSGPAPGTDFDTVVSTVNLTIDASIENLTLTGTATTGTGNAGANKLLGNALANTLDGAGGADALKGGKGDDTYIVDNLGDDIIENAGEGSDTVKASVTFTLDANVEKLTLTGADSINGAGNDLNNTIIGNDVANKLEGLANSDTLNGGLGSDTLDGGLGNDRLIGGDGDDTYIVDSIADVVVENVNEGLNDKVLSTVSYSIASVNGINDLHLLGIFNLNGTGNGSSNHIVGNVGKNVLDGGLNAKDVTAGDTLEGGANDDTYIIRNANDQVVELADGGHDLVQSALSFSLAANGANVEDLVLTGTAVIDGTGNDLANKLTGNAVANKLDGGAGDDTMIGAAGDDSYVVDSVGDVITDASGADEVFFTGKDQSALKLYTGVEHYNFSLLDAAAGPVTFTGTTAANRVTGTGLDDSLAGGSGNDTLDGGAGNDTMDGGVGNDTYVIDVATDKITDSGKDTGDTVQTGTAALHIDLTDVGFFAGIENVSFTGKEDLNATGTAVKNVLTGNDGDNVLIGNGDNDTLIGGGGGDTLVGGTGSDSMAGGTGNDVYDVDIAGDKVLENKDAGIDVVRSTINYILGANLEALVLIGTGNLNGTGNELDNAINGTDGNNILDGKQGDDILEGFGGDDTYIVDKIFVDNPDPIPDTGDKVVETEKGGHDTVKSTVTYSIAAFENVEDLTLIGGLHIDGTGNKLDNVLTGNGAFNKLDGGLGADTMKGGAGDDTYAIDDKDDKVDETGGSGLNDTAVFVMTDPLDEQAIADKFAAQLIGGVLTSKLIGGVEHYDFAKFTTDVDLNIAGDNAANRIIATKFADTLTGNGGNDTLDGGLGIDSLTGGLGNDTYVIDTLDDKIVELKNGGTDTIVSLLTDYTLKEPDGLNYNFENLTIGDDAEGGDANGTGNSAANVVRGNAFDNKLFGVGGNDTIFGGTGDDTLDGGIGNDSMVGGFGSDTYILDSKSDKVLEGPNPGINDTVIAPFDYTLGANVENLTITGTAKIATGNTSGNHIIGNDLDNVIDGKGGIDKLEGGKGDDTYIVREIPEAGVTEQADGGNDTIKTSWFDAPMPDNVENLIFTMGYHNTGIGNASDNHIVGHVVSDTLDGNAGDDTLDGGAGADVLTGGKGDDTYIVDNAKDVVVEFPGAPEGIDTIQAKMSIDLAKYENFNLEVIENVTLTGASALIATGNTLDNLLTGNTGANKLLGNAGNDTLNGGQGGDSMVGGADNDTYFVDSAADKVDETGGTGTDTVSSAITFNLTANGTSVKGELENLTLTGTGTINGTGNSFDNIIHGNDKANKLDGGGGADTITGHGGIDQIDVVNGNDTVRFESVLDGHDVIANFDGDAAGGQDTVDLDALFDSLSIAGPDRAGRVSLTPGVGTVDVSVDVSALHDGSNVITFGTLNTIDAITVGQDVLVGA